MKIECYVRHGAHVDIHPAPATREWMDRTPNRHAYRCLPLGIANSHGWEIRCAQAFSARWNGGPLTTDVTFKLHGDAPDHAGSPVVSAFGSGIITFHVPCLFRTPPGINLWVTGPVNSFKDGVQPLSGMVETDWLTQHGFTMNWKITRPYYEIRFERGEPYCFLFPVPRGLIESLTPELHDFDDDPALAAEYDEAERQRRAFQDTLGMQADGLATHVPADEGHRWQRAYFQGRDAQGNLVEGHQTRLHVKPFSRQRRTSEP